ncbi:acid protease [Xylariaceae sp. FL0016]|nr:acid protease [Xylariaceae sp. FL0016]
MHRALILLHLSLWITSINALWPFASEAHEEVTRRGVTGGKPLGGFVTFKLVQKDSSATDLVSRGTYQSYRQWSKSKPRTQQGDATLSERDNTYTIVEAEEPTVKDAAGVDQDGTDYSYFVEAKLGSGGKSMYMLLDTGASTTWVPGSGCTSDTCSKHNTFGPNDSDTYVDTGSTYSVEYGTGSVSGHVIKDTISVGGISATVSFGVANTTSDEFSQFAFDGILGLSMGSDTWLTAVKNANVIESNIFGISLSRASDGTNDGEIVIGGPNPAKYTGDISYTSINSGNTWNIPMDDVTVGGDSAGVTGRAAYIDTGTTYAFGPPDDVKKLYSKISGSETSDDSTWTVPCDSDAEVAFEFSGASWAVSSKDFISAPDSDGKCTGNIYGMEYVAGAWLLGDVFLKNVYSVYDADEGKIGFAAKATGNTTESNSTTTSTTSSSTATATGMGLNGQETPSADSSSGAAGASATGASSGGKVAAHSTLAFIISALSIVVMIS